jgi:hypothetical protein
MKGNRTALRKHLKGADDLLNIAVRLQASIDKSAPAPSDLRVKLGLALVLLDKAIAAPAHDDGLLRAAQIMRAAGIVNHDYAFYVIHGTTEQLVYKEHVGKHREVIEIDPAILGIETVHGLKDDELCLQRGNWSKGKVPDAIEQPWDSRQQRIHKIESGVLREYGEAEMWPTFFWRTQALSLPEPRRAEKNLMRCWLR